MPDDLVSRLQRLADEANESARNQLGVRDSDYQIGRAIAFLEAARLAMEADDDGS